MWCSPTVHDGETDLLIRLVLSAIPLGICWWFGRELADANMRVLLMLPGLLAAALIVFPSLTSAAGFQVSKIYYGHQQDVKGPDVQSTPSAART